MSDSLQRDSGDGQASRSVLISGCSTGIGRACAVELDRRGYRVFAGVRNDEDAAQLRQATSERLTPVMLDITRQEMISQAVDRVREATGEAGLDALINNAGIVTAFPLEVLPIDELRRQFEVNVFGHLAVTQRCLGMLRQTRGRIVNISSTSAFVAAPYVGAYAASKHALEALTDALRVEQRHFGIKIALVEPGDVKTPIWQKSRQASDALRERLLEQLGEELDAVPEQIRDRYQADIQAMRAATDKMAQQAMSVERVVRAVMHALTARRPKGRYPLGARTWAVMLGLRNLPVGLRDRLVTANLGMK